MILSVALGIKAFIDFAFKKIFASPGNEHVLISLLNAILSLKHPIVSVELLNPFSMKEFQEQKQVLLDIVAKDSTGRVLNIEMQVSVVAGLLQRLVFYACKWFVNQMKKADAYPVLHPVISICLLDDVLFRDTNKSCHRFMLSEEETGLKIPDAIEVHVVELTKYNVEESTICQASPLEQWIFFILKAHEYTAEQLRKLLPGIDFETAIKTIESIAQKTENKMMYDLREKAQMDYEWAISGARQEGIEQGIEQGVDIGKLTGKVQILQELLGEQPSTDEALRKRPLGDLQSLIAELQDRLRKRS